MKSLMSFVFLMPMMFSAAQAAPVVDRGLDREETRIQPYPYPVNCPEGTYRVFDEYKGGYTCVPYNHCGPRPYSRFEEPAKKLRGVLGGDDQSAKGAALNAFFDAAQSRKSDAGAVPAGDWGSASSGPAALKPYDPAKGAALVRVGEKGAAAGAIAGGVATGGHVVGEALGGLAGSKAEDKFNSGMDKLGDKLRDRNDEKLRQGTQAQKDAEKKWPKK